MIAARCLLSLLIAGALGLSSFGSWAQGVQEQFPTRVVRIIVPYPPGTLSDVLPRFIAQRLSKDWGQAVVVDNKPGANGIIGTQEGAKAAPNGYTWMVGAHATMA